jgi:hypothetical protein
MSEVSDLGLLRGIKVSMGRVSGNEMLSDSIREVEEEVVFQCYEECV